MRKRCVHLIGRTDTKKEVTQMLATLRGIRDGRQKDNEELACLLGKVGIDAYTMAREYLRGNEI